MNTESLKCSLCFEVLTNGEQSLRCPQIFGSCDYTVCASCMQHEVDSYRITNVLDAYTTCHQCRVPSDKVPTNLALMQLTKEIPGQPQRVVEHEPQAVPIVAAPWRFINPNQRLSVKEAFKHPFFTSNCSK